MARSRGPFTLCAAALLLCTITTVASDKCRTGCHGVTPNTFKYQEGTTYKYNLEGNVDISISSAENQHTSTKLTGTVLLTQQADCNQVLRLQNVQVVGADAKKYGNLANIEKAIKLNFHDGHIEDEICAEADDTQHSLNIKRAVASMFQAVLKDTEETDVFGKCPNDISSRKDGNTLIIQKSRDLTRCSHHEAFKQELVATSLNLKSLPGSSPFIPTYESEQRIKNGILEHAIVNEHYLYKLLSDGKDHGIKVVVTTKLNLAGQNKEKVAVKASEPKPIYFDSPHQEVTKTANIDSILNALRETKKTMDVSVSEKSASTFFQLIQVLRASKKDDILAVYGQVKSGAGGIQDKQGARKVFFDALFRTGTGDAIEVIVELLKNKELSAIEQKLVYLSLSFVKHSTRGSLNSVIALLDQPDLPREAYLGVGTLAGRFCGEHNCENVEELNKLMQKLTSKLNSQPGNRKAENEVLAVLKALGNIHHLSDAVIEKLVQIANDKKAPTRLRVGALEAAVTDACKPKLINAALNILKNRQEDSEIRIKAYLVVTECPDNKVANALKELLESEPVYQVGSYISSHLRNLRASANPDRQHAKQVLANVRCNKKFPIDPRKYSFNNELSYNFDTIGNGNSLESDVIYSQNSFLPRSINLNLTTDLFGHSFNFLEIGARQENLDKVLEHYFGPLGVLNTHAPEDLFKSGKASLQKIADHIKQRLDKTRGKRDVSKNEIETFAKTVKVLGSELNKDLDLDLSLKIFGSELMFLSINEDIQKLTPDAIIDKLFDNVDQGLEKAKNFEYQLKNHLLLTDLEINYPTSIGFPIRFTMQGTAAVHFITSGNIDIRQILKDPQNAQLKLKVIPSANIEVSGTIGIDAHFVQTGIKISNNILTSTGTDLSIKLLNNKGIDIKLGLPVEKQKVISFSRDIEFFNQELGKPVIPVPLKFKDKQREFSVCFDQLSPVIGLSFCGEMNTPTTLMTNGVGFPLNGNIKVELGIEREDLKEYHFKALLNEPNPSSKSLEISFEAPGQKSERKVSLLLEAATTPNKVLRATLKSPLKDAVAEAVITDNNQEKSAMLRFQHDNHEYMGKIGVSVQGNDAKHIYKPLIEYSTPQDVVKTKGNRKPDYTVEGQVIVEKNGDNCKYTFDHVKLVAPGQPNIEITGYLARDGPTAYSTDLKVSRDNANVATKGKLQFSPENLQVNAEVHNSINPSANFNLKVNLKRGDREFDNSIVLIHGNDLSSKKHQLSITNSAKYKYENKDNFDFEMKNKVTYPLLGIEGKLDAKASKKHVSYDFTVAYDKFNLESELDAKVCTKQVGDYDIKFELECMNNKVELKAKRDITGDKSNIHNSLDISGRKYQLDGTVTHHIKPNDINIGSDLTLKVHEKPDAIKVDTGLVSNSQELDSHAKITVGSTNTVDIVVKGARGANPHGTLKVFVLNLVNANGKFQMTGGKGAGDILIEIPKLDRKIKADTAITCQDPTHNVELNVYFNFEKDNSQKLHIQSNNQLTKTSFETKNVLELLQHKFAANAKGAMEGKFTDGKMHGEFDLTSSCGRVFTGSLNRELHPNEAGFFNGNMDVVLATKENKDAPACKLHVKAQAKDTQFSRRVFDLTYNIVAEHHNGKNIKADIVLKHNHNGDKHESFYKSKIYGTVLPQSLDTEINAHYSHAEGDHKASVMYGSNLGAKVAGKYNYAIPGKQNSGNLDVEIILPNEQFKNIKLNMNGKALVPQQPEGTLEADGSITGTLNNAKTVKVAGNVKASKQNGNVKLDVTLPDSQPLGFGANYNLQKTESGCKCQGEVNLKYAQDKEVKAGLTLNKVNNDEMDMELNLVTPSEAAKNINLRLKHKRSNGGKNIHNEIIATCDQKKYTLVHELVLSEISPSLDVKLTCPEGKTSRIYAKFIRVSPKQYTGEVKIENIKDFNLDASGKANLESVDDFHVTLNINSEKLKLDKVKIEAQNKPSKDGKRIQFSAKSGDKNLLSGSTSYKANEDGGKFIVEGSGTVKVREESRTATFKFMKQQVQNNNDNEQGIEILLNAGIGKQGIVGELKLTNKNFRFLNSYCEEKEQCAHVEINSKTNTIDATEFNHELEVNIDLRKLGLSHEFGLKAVTNRKNFILDHTVDVHFESSANSKYQYSVYVHPKEAGIQLTTPKRIVALEGKGDITKGKVQAEVALYMNKKAEPNKKTVVSYSCTHGGDNNSGHANVEIKLSNPATNKDLIVQYTSKFDIPKKSADLTLDLDIFAKKNQKISLVFNSRAEKLENGYKVIAEGTVASKGLGLEMKYYESFAFQPQNLDYLYKLGYQLDKTKHESSIAAKLNPKQFEVLLKLMNRNLLHIDSSLQLSKEAQIADTKISAVGIDDLVTHTELKNFNTFLFTINRKATPQNIMKISSAFVVGKSADFKIETTLNNAKNDIVHASVQLDDANFLKPDFGVKTEYIQKTLLPHIINENKKSLEVLKNTAEEFSKAITTDAKQAAELAKKSVPNMKPVAEYYKDELLKIKDELVSDKTFQELSDFVKKIFGAIAGTLAEVYTRLNEVGDKLIALGSENFARITDVIAKDVLPAIKEVGGKILDVYVSLMKSVYDLAMIYVVKLSEILKAHQDEIKHIATVICEAFQGVGRVFLKFATQMKDDIVVVVKNVYEKIKALPIVEELQERYKDLLSGMPVPEQVLNILSEFFGTVKDVMPTEELKHFINVVQDYIGKKLRKESVDDAEALKQMYSSLVKAINSLIKFIQNQHVEHGDYKTVFQNLAPVRLDRFFSTPRISALRLSPLSLLLNGDLPSIKQLLVGVSFHPVDLLPPMSHHATIVQGQHVFTFDDRHLTFPGKCNYVLVQDAVNKNFTLIGEYKDGQLEAITFSDKQTTITYKKNGPITLNGQPSELPVRQKELEVFRLYTSVVLISKAGLKVIVTPDLQAVIVDVNGFYHAQLRGLLGNANYEPYDDFIQPNGKIANNEADFGNAYKVNAACGAVKTVDHSAHHANPACDALFGSDSPMRPCFLFVDPEGYRQACEHGMASNIPETEAYIAGAFVSECRHRNIPVNVPAKYVKCINSDKPVDLDDQFSVKVPSKAADVVIVVDQSKNVEPIFKELVQPVVTQVTNELTAKGISDIEFSLLGYGGEYQQYPSHYTTGGKLAFHEKTLSLKFSDEEVHKPIDTGCKHLDYVIETLTKITKEVKYQLTMIPAIDALKEAVQYPFRPNAVKTIIFVSGEHEYKLNPLLTVLKYISLYGRRDGIHMNLITPIEDLKVTGKDAKQVKNIVGFNDHTAYTLADAKKKGEGSSDLRKEIEYGLEYSADYFINRHGGNVFDSNNFKQAKGGQKKQFVQVVANVIAQDMINTEYGMDCQCKRTDPFHAMNVCKVVSVKGRKSVKG